MATAKKQEVVTVIIIVKTLMQAINPTLEPVMRVTVSCVKINQNIVHFIIVEKYSKLI